MRVYLILLFLFSSLVLTGCLKNVGGKYELFIEQNQKIFDFSNSGDYTFSASDIDITSDIATIATNYTVVDLFNDADDSAWTGFNYSGVTQTLTETTYLQYSCSIGIMGVELTAPQVLTDYTAYVEQTPLSSEVGTPYLVAAGRFTDANNFYLAVINGANFAIYRVLAGAITNIGQVAAPFVPSLGTTYKIKMRFSGTTIQAKAWVSTDNEPGSYQVTTVDANHANGNFALGCNRGSGRWDNARNYDSTKTTDYDTDNPTIIFPEYEITDEILSRWGTISVDATISGSDAIRYDLSYDGGSTFLVYSGGTWVSNSSYSSAMTLSQVNTYLKNFPTDTSSITIRAYLHSNDGTTTPAFNKLTLNYTTELQ